MRPIAHPSPRPRPRRSTTIEKQKRKPRSEKSGLTTGQVWPARAAAALSQRDLAKLAGLDEGTIRYIEKGNHEPSAATLRKIEIAFRAMIEIEGSIPFLVEIANGSVGFCHLFEAAFQVRLQRGAQAGQLLAAAHLVWPRLDLQQRRGQPTVLLVRVLPVPLPFAPIRTTLPMTRLLV